MVTSIHAFPVPAGEEVVLSVKSPNGADTDVNVAASLYAEVVAPSGFEAIADELLKRAVSNVEDTADKHSLAAFVMIATNGSASGTTLTAKKPSDDSTFQTYTLTTDSGADPVTGVE